MRQLPQEDHADLGLIPDSDHTEVLITRKAPVAADALRNEPPQHANDERKF